MNAEQVIEEIKKLGSPAIKNIFKKHGAPGTVYGVKIEDLKKIQKKTKNDQKLAMDLYESGISDAMYLAGLMADGSKMSEKDLQRWVEKADWQMLSEYSVPWVASENPQGWELGMKWIDSSKETISSAGWATLSAIIATRPDDELDIATIKKLLSRIEKEVHSASNRVRYTMNGFVIAIGGYITSLTKTALDTAKKIGNVSVEMGDTACKVPLATDNINKMIAKGLVGKKRKTAKC